MKDFYRFLFLLLLTLEAHSQNFSPFRPGRLAQYSAVAGDTVRLIQLQRRGRAAFAGMDSLYLFALRAGAPRNGSGGNGFFGCYPRATGGPFGQALGINYPGTMQVEYWLLGDYNASQNFYQSELLLKPRAPLNQPWTANSRGTTARVVSRVVQSVLGVPDSVVTIAFASGQQLMLSKAHGLVEAPALAYFAANGAARRQALTALPGTGLGQAAIGALAVYDFQPGDRFVYRYTRTTLWGSTTPGAPPDLTYLFADSILSRTTSRTGDTLTYRVLTCSAQGNGPSTLATVHYTSASGPGTRTSQQYLRGVSPLSSVGTLFSGTMIYDAVRGPYPTNRPVQRVLYLPLCFGDTLTYAGPNIDLYAGANYATGLGQVSNYMNDFFSTTTTTVLVGYRKGAESWGMLPRLLCRPLATTSHRPATTTAAFPNPFGAELAVAFTLTHPQNVALTLHDALGRVALQKDAGPLPAGAQRLALATAGLPAGLYTVHLRFAQDGHTEVLKVLKTQ